MLRFENHALTKVVLLASIIVAALSQQINAIATPSNDLLQKAQAIELDPKFSKNYVARAKAFNKLGLYQRALQDYNKALTLNSKNARLYVERGFVYSCLGKSQKAVEDFSVAIKIYPRSCEDYLVRSEAYGELGQYQKQIDDLTSAIKSSPKDADLYERRAYPYYLLGQLQNAIDDCTTALSLDPTSSYACNNAAPAYEELGLYEKAIDVRTKILGFKKKNAFAWINRADDYEMLGKLDLAQVDRQRAYSLASSEERVSMQHCNPLIDFDNHSKRTMDEVNKQLKNNSVVLSFEYDAGGHICVPVQVNGHSLQLMLDTGSAHTDLWKESMHKIAKLDDAQVRGRAANGQDYFQGFFKARHIKLGDVTLPNIGMGVDKGLVGHKTLNGFFGSNVLKNFVVTVDYSKKLVILATSFDQGKSRKAIILPMRIRNHCPYCIVTLDGKIDRLALLDTGCPRSMSADSLLKPIIAKKLYFKEHASGPWLGSLSIEYFRLQSLGLGRCIFNSPTLDVFPAAEAPNAASTIVLGNDILRRFRAVTFDYPARRVIFELM